jgi:hypothetical protein
LEYKTEIIDRELQQSRFNWEQTFYLFLARNFGTAVNGGGLTNPIITGVVVFNT